MKIHSTAPTTPPTMYYVWGEKGEFSQLNGRPHLVSAGVAHENPGDGFAVWIPDNVGVFNNDGDAPLMVDSGGFQAATKWENCAFPYTPRELFEWAEDIGADVVAGMDVACEQRELLMQMDSCKVDPGSIEHRLEQSLHYQIEQYEVYKEKAWNFDFMPVVQGNTVTQYKEFLQDLQRHGLTSVPRIGIGSTCKRDSKDDILQVAKTVRRNLSWHTGMHLFGATLNIWKDTRFWNLFTSSDTAAWKYMAESKEHKKELLTEYVEKVENESRKIGGNQRLSGHMNVPTYQQVYDARWGNIEAMEQLADMGFYDDHPP